MKKALTRKSQKLRMAVLAQADAKELLETKEILADPNAMKAIHDAETNRGKVYDAKDLPE